jgi:hypothetical protein
VNFQEKNHPEFVAFAVSIGKFAASIGTEV